MKNIENIMTILHKENNHEKINKLEEIKILKEASSLNIYNDAINGRDDPLYKILLSVESEIPTRRQPKQGQRYFNKRPASLKMCS